MSVDDIVVPVIRDKPFFDTSGGGVTLSGGEPTLLMDFLARLLAALKADGIHALLETCGQFDGAAFMDRILPFIDVIYFDIKLMDPKLHKKYCGASNRTILENFIRLNERAVEGAFMLVPRTPLIPGITATTENLAAIAGFLAGQNIKKSQLLPYNSLWSGKKRKIGIAGPEKATGDQDNWIPREQIMMYRSIFADHGIAT